MMVERATKAPEYFLVAVDRQTGKIAGILNGLATDETTFRDEFFTNAELHVPEGKTVMLLGLAVLPEYRGEGLARALMYRYLCRMVQKKKTWYFSPVWIPEYLCMKKWDFRIRELPIYMGRRRMA